MAKAAWSTCSYWTSRTAWCRRSGRSSTRTSCTIWGRFLMWRSGGECQGTEGFAPPWLTLRHGANLSPMATDFTEETAADAVVDSFAKTPDPRLRELLSGLVRHLHA